LWIVLSGCETPSLAVKSFSLYGNDYPEAYRVESVGLPHGPRIHVLIGFPGRDERAVLTVAREDWVDGEMPWACCWMLVCRSGGHWATTASTRTLTDAEGEGFRDAVERSEFWKGSTFESNYFIYDGWSVTFEGHLPGQHKAIHGSNPARGPMVELAEELLRLAHAPVDKGASYNPITNEITLP
jgi:hypothetical protein